ncbi:MAG: VPLPA-CTERM sorting domain-containing protein [Pseudomonadota bacterium]
MRSLKTLAGAIAAGAALFGAQAYAGVMGVTVDPDTLAEVGNTGDGDILTDAIEYFIPLGDVPGGSCTYGVTDVGGGICGTFSDNGTGGDTLSMYILFDGLTAGTEQVLTLLFEDLDLEGDNDPAGFLETVAVFDMDGMLIEAFDSITDGMFASNGDGTSVLSLLLGVIADTSLLLRLDFTASFEAGGDNTAEYLIAELKAVPIPAALPLFLAGLAGLGFAGRRRKSA